MFKVFFAYVFEEGSDMRSNVFKTMFYRRLSVVLALLLTFSVVFIETPLVYAADSIKVEFFNGETYETVSTVYPKYKVTNTGTTDIDASKLKLRYYFTDDDVSPISVTVDFASKAGATITNSVTASIKTTNAKDANCYL